MDENFTKFNSSIFTRINEFINSPDDLLYVSGFQGCGKSEIVNKALSDINDENVLLFRHLCFENSAIDDFLLGFYDTLRYYSINKRINLKKSLTENFAQKVSFYFKNLDKKSLIVIDNFEIISENSEIIDFLAHLGKFENVKLILISRILNTGFFEDKGLNFKIIDILPNDYTIFKTKVTQTLEMYEETDIQELFEQTKGYELYLKMSLRYISTVNTTLKEFIEEFKKRDMEFADFLLSKIVSLVPPIYLPFLQNMACLNHSVNIGFIEHYKLGDVSLVNYLYKKMLISKFDNEIYLKDYLKTYFLQSLSVSEKIENYSRLVEIYRQELAKSPRDRLLRLSRESIRKQMEFVKQKIPSVSEKKGITGTNFAYIGQTAGMQGYSQPWYMKMALKEGEKFKKNKEKSFASLFKPKTNEPKEAEPLQDKEIENIIEAKPAPEAQLTGKENAQNLIKEAKELEKAYDYKGAIELFTEALKNVQEEKTKIQTRIEIARNYVKINGFEAALKNYEEALSMAKAAGDEAQSLRIRFNEGVLYKNMYRFKQAKACLNEVAASKTDLNAAAEGYLELGEIFEMENDYKSALENYEKALQAANNGNPDDALRAQIYFKTALLYDDGQNPQKALEYYKKSIEAGEKSEHKFIHISTCFANMGLIHSEFWAENGLESELQESINSFEKALKTDKKENNPNGIYFASKQLAGILRDINPQKSLKYMVTALEAAINLDDNFKTALSYLEIGDYYYNTQENKKALTNYLEARKALGNSITEENRERISIRINDMKIKMEKEEFLEILNSYEQKSD